MSARPCTLFRDPVGLGARVERVLVLQDHLERTSHAPPTHRTSGPGPSIAAISARAEAERRPAVGQFDGAAQ